MDNSLPYISLVVTARNDDHGGNLLGRMQVFVSGWIAQCRRHRLPAELIVVEWNPPPDRPSLHEALEWPDAFGPCEVRFVEVPGELHRRYAHAGALPLYQMVAKNVGIRRARGQFVLASNIDILFSDELVAFLAEQRLDGDCMYRIDRHDAASDVPMEASIDGQLEYCRTHLLRINCREGTFPVTLDGRPAMEKEDIASAGSGITLGRRWFPVERYSDGEPFRWVENDAEIDLTLPQLPHPVLCLDLEPGPGMGQRPMALEILDGDLRAGTVTVYSRSELRIPFSQPLPTTRKLRLRVSGGGDQWPYDMRTLNFRVFSCQWNKKGRGLMSAPTVRRRARLKKLFTLWRQVQFLLRRIAKGGPLVTITLPVSRQVKRAICFYVESRGFTGILRRGLSRGRRSRSAPEAQPVAEVSAKPVPLLHTNACGDFTLLARRQWFDLRAYPEFDLFSMNIDSLFCIAAHFSGVREQVLSDPMRIYHIEHGTGSGWTPEGQVALFARLAAHGIPFLDNTELLNWAMQMSRLNSPMIFNQENWGLAAFDLKETVVRGRR